MRPNRTVLGYLVVWGGALAATALLATTEAGLRLYRALSGQPAPSLAEWVVIAAVVALGVLPWPGVMALARAALRPKRLDRFEVRSRSVGQAAVVVPALNEEPAIEEVVRGFAATPFVGTVIVVDNGSTDRTAELAAASGARVVSEFSRGYGHACTRALTEGLHSGYPVVVLVEADGTFRADDLEKLAAYLKHADLVLGSRTHGFFVNSDSQLNSFLALGNLIVAKLLQCRYWDWVMGGRVRLTDVGCTYRAIRAEALGKILPALRVGGSHFAPHMVMVALERGLQVVEVPVTFWRRVGISKGGNASWWAAFTLGLRMIWDILTYRVVRTVEVRESPSDELTHALSP